ncbi:MAG TPA: tetratricopeptide repeat protein [Gammaproteobacteria bacterium]|nr:tetratricopeptide repeat protein [Gammaproteobacteria bacterium]
MDIKLLILLGVLLTTGNVAFAGLNEDILSLQQQWARANYDTSADTQEQAFKDLVADGRKLVERYPDRAEPKVWLAISLSTDAGVNGGFSALGKVKEARRLLEAAEKIDPEVLNGSIYTSLGSLYYQVPGWPIEFGDDDKARTYLEKALAVNPKGIDPNYFYGDFLLESGDYAQAITYLTRANQAPERPGRPLADAGRRIQLEEKLDQARSKL